MTVPDDLVLYESEHSALDFKREQYSKPKHADLLKDLMALANAHVTGDRHIVVGVTPVPGGPHNLHSIPAGSFVDDADYQQLVRANIEPQLHFSYAAQIVNGATVGVFTLRDCTNRPYLMRKDFQPLQRGEGFIRKGSSQHRLGRDDLDRIYGERLQSEQPSDLRVTFDGLSATTLNIRGVQHNQLPSFKAVQKIEEILEDRRRRTVAAQRPQPNQDPRFAFPSLLGDPINNPPYAFSVTGSVPYEKRSTEDLKRNLTNIRDDYANDDVYAMLETHATRIEPTLFNGGQTCLYGAVVEIELTPPKDLLVATDLAEDPTRGPYGERWHLPPIGYPSCSRNGDTLTFRAEVGDVRPGERVPMLQEGIRTAALNVAEPFTVSLLIRVLGRNLQEPERFELQLLVGNGSGA